MEGNPQVNSCLLIINADDAGLHPDIDAGILDTVMAGMVRSVSLFVNGPYVFDPIPFIGAGVSLGLHFNLTLGSPCLSGESSSLTDGSGVFFPDGHEHTASFKENDIRRELKAQLRRFQEIVGSAPSHLDAHKHLHRRDKNIFRIMMEATRDLAIPLRCPTDTMRQFCRREGIATTDHFTGGVDPAPYWTKERIKTGLSGLLPGVTEMMCHPGRKTGPIDGLRYVNERNVERESLISASIAGLPADVKLTNFRDAFSGNKVAHEH